MNRPVDRRTRHALAAAATLTSVLALSACGSGATPAAGAATAPAQGSTQAGAAGGRAGRAFPGTSGLVAEVTGTTAQVQSAQSQTAVTWTKSTTFTAQTATTASSLRIGDCVSARPARATGAPGSTATGTPAPNTGSAGTTTVTAATVEIFPATNGGCATTGLAGGGGFGAPSSGGRGAGGFGRGSGAPQPTAPGQGSGTSTGAPNGFGGQFRGATGKVTALDGASFTVQPVARRAQDGSTTTAAPSPVTVTYAASTTFTRSGKATAAAVKVGLCLTAFGKADDTGAVTATAIQLSQPVGGSCTTGFRLGGGAGRPGAAPTGTPNA